MTPVANAKKIDEKYLGPNATCTLLKSAAGKDAYDVAIGLDLSCAVGAMPRFDCPSRCDERERHGRAYHDHENAAMKLPPSAANPAPGIRRPVAAGFSSNRPKPQPAYGIDPRASSEHGRNHGAGQAPWLYFSVERDLRGHRRLLRLRPAGCNPQAQREKRLVARHGRTARRRRGIRFFHYHAPAYMEGLRTRRRLSRSHGRLQGLQTPLSGGPSQVARPMPGLRKQKFTHRAAQLQFDDEDARGADGRYGFGSVPSPRNRSGHLRQLQEHLSDGAQEAAV